MTLGFCLINIKSIKEYIAATFKGSCPIIYCGSIICVWQLWSLSPLKVIQSSKIQILILFMHQNITMHFVFLQERRKWFPQNYCFPQQQKIDQKDNKMDIRISVFLSIVKKNNVLPLSSLHVYFVQQSQFVSDITLRILSSGVPTYQFMLGLVVVIAIFLLFG